MSKIFFFWWSLLYVNATLNIQNNRIWAKEKPFEDVEYPLYDQNFYFSKSRNKAEKSYWCEWRPHWRKIMKIMSEINFLFFNLQNGMLGVLKSQRIKIWLTFKVCIIIVGTLYFIFLILLLIFFVDENIKYNLINCFHIWLNILLLWSVFHHLNFQT